MINTATIESLDANPLRYTISDDLDGTPPAGAVAKFSYYRASPAAANGFVYLDRAQLKAYVTSWREISNRGNANQSSAFVSLGAVPLRITSTVPTGTPGTDYPEGATLKTDNYVASGGGAINSFAFWDTEKLEEIFATMELIGGF